MSTLVLVSGGLDSAVLAAHESQTGPVLPVYVSAGFHWEAAELATVARLLAAPPFGARLAPLERVSFTMQDVYPAAHWALRGGAPAYDTGDAAVYLPGRNLALLAKAGVVAARAGAARIALGPLAGNPFPDARPAFFDAMRAALSLGLDHPLDVAAPFLEWSKADVIRRGVALGVPLEATLSCMRPDTRGAGPARHCGACSKCRERREAFAAAAVADRTVYALPAPARA